MSEDSMFYLKYAINLGYYALKEAYNVFESIEPSEKRKYWQMVEELAEELGVPPEDIADEY